MKKLLATFCFLSTMFAQNASIRLADVRKIYIEKMDNGFDQNLRAAISKKFHDRITIVLNKEEAEAIMTAPNMKQQHTENATVDLTDPNGKVVLWSGSANDKSQAWLNLRHGGRQKIADHLASDLKKAMEH
jgi:hypothetical protein